MTREVQANKDPTKQPPHVKLGVAARLRREVAKAPNNGALAAMVEEFTKVTNRSTGRTITKVTYLHVALRAVVNNSPRSGRLRFLGRGIGTFKSDRLIGLDWCLRCVRCMIASLFLYRTHLQRHIMYIYDNVYSNRRGFEKMP